MRRPKPHPVPRHALACLAAATLLGVAAPTAHAQPQRGDDRPTAGERDRPRGPDGQRGERGDRTERPNRPGRGEDDDPGRGEGRGMDALRTATADLLRELKPDWAERIDAALASDDHRALRNLIEALPDNERQAFRDRVRETLANRYQQRDRDGTGRGNPRGGRLSPEQVAEVIDILNDVRPALGQRLRAAYDQDPDTFLERVRGGADILRQVAPLLGLQQRDPELFELRKQDLALTLASREQAAAVHTAREAGDTDAAAQSLAELRDTLSDHFDVRTQVRELELSRLQARLDQMQAELDDAYDRRDAVIQSELDRLTKPNND